jgi:molybdopterin converting factor small subunit
LSITVNLYAAARHAAQLNSLTVEAASLVEVKAELIQQIPGLASVIPQCSFIVDGHSFGSSGDCDVYAGQQIDVLPPFSGG